MFQSRNRETYDSNSAGVPTSQFQSRNRETYERPSNSISVSIS